jgi:hypothetical protein
LKRKLASEKTLFFAANDAKLASEINKKEILRLCCPGIEPGYLQVPYR